MSTTASDTQLDQLSVNAIRFLAIDAVQTAKSGHPGAPMGAAGMAYVLWDRFLKHNPRDTRWPDRDRFVLSAGHASMLLYALLHLTGYDVSIEDIKQFRQWGSKTAGHPEYGLAPGVEMTTGPLGQGFAHGVGMALAERWLATHYNRPGHEIINHYTYGIVSDGDLMEGVSSEAASLAGTWKLGKLIYLYDRNNISIEGTTVTTFTEDVGARFIAYGWHVIGPVDGTETEAIAEAVAEAQAENERPSLIIVQTTIGYGSPNKAGTGAAHGEPLGAEEVERTRQELHWQHAPFEVPPEVINHFRKAVERGPAEQAVWKERLAEYQKTYPVEAMQLKLDLSGDLPVDWDSGLDTLFSSDEKLMATRDASGRVLNYIASRVHGLVGGSADLGPSNKSVLKEHANVGFDAGMDHNIQFGVREHAMAAIAGGMALHGGVIPYAATFLVFSDYMRPPMRLAALMEQRVVYIFTHDSIGVGEDGPTHQPVEHLLALRGVPELVVIRPADATETAEAWRIAMERRDGPTALILTRQALPIIDRSAHASAAGVQRGGYVLRETGMTPEALLIATGSEVPIALEAADILEKRGVATRVVSLPSWELFDAQPKTYRDAVIPPSVKARVSVEAGTTLGWERYVGEAGYCVGVDRFGASAPLSVVYRELGITAERVAEEAEALVRRGT